MPRDDELTSKIRPLLAYATIVVTTTATILITRSAGFGSAAQYGVLAVVLTPVSIGLLIFVEGLGARAPRATSDATSRTRHEGWGRIELFQHSDQRNRRSRLRDAVVASVIEGLRRHGPSAIAVVVYGLSLLGLVSLTIILRDTSWVVPLTLLLAAVALLPLRSR